MGQQSSSLTSPRVELTRTKHHVVTNGVGTGIDIPRRLFGSWAEMHANPRKVVPKALFHFPLYRRRRVVCRRWRGHAPHWQVRWLFQRQVARQRAGYPVRR